jgi:hypothetical protein
LINLHSSSQVAHFMGFLRDLHCSSLIKSHHPAGTLAASLGTGLKVAMILRHPAEVLLSYWRWLPSLPWHESDRWDSPAALARGVPAGACQRYQQRGVASHFERWASHAQGWLDLHLAQPRQVGLVSYAELLEQHESTMRGLCASLGIPLTGTPEQPDRHSNVVVGSDQAISHAQWQDLLELCEQGLARFPQLAARLKLSGRQCP